jgi:hypothetical protein
MADLMAAEVQRENGVTKNTRDKESRVWRRWVDYTKCINFDQDIWLQRLTAESRTVIIGAFAAALRRRHFSKPDDSDLASSTVQEAVTKLGEIFRANVGYNPAHVPGSNSLHPSLSRQFKGMKNADPGEKQQRALPVCVYRTLHQLAYSSSLLCPDLDAAVADILILAFFFCMRSCEYSDVQGERRTKILCVRNIRFFNSHNQDISDRINDLDEAVTVSLTFEFQKRDVRNDIISHQRLGDKRGTGCMCPVLAAISIVRRLHSYGLSPNKFVGSQINTVKSGENLFTIPSSMFLHRIRSTVDLLGPEKLGFSSGDVGTHSNRSGGAMGMFLAGTPIYTIMLIGRWSSDAFMRYIRKQVLQLSHGIAAKMLTFEEFYTVPDFIHSDADGNINYRGENTLASTHNLDGSHANMRRGLHPAFHLNH